MNCLAGELTKTTQLIAGITTYYVEIILCYKTRKKIIMAEAVRKRLKVKVSH